MKSPIFPDNDNVLAIWRVGLIAYRYACRRELPALDQHPAGIAAMMEAFPQLAREEASEHMINAIAWCTTHHIEWLQCGVPRREWIWPPDQRGMGLNRNAGYEGT
jgi:hypothetical protein